MSAGLCGFVVVAGLVYAAVTRVDGTLRGLPAFRGYAEQRKALEAERLQADADSAKAWKWLDDRGFVMDSWEDVKAACEDHGKSTRGVAKALQEVTAHNHAVGERLHGNAELAAIDAKAEEQREQAEQLRAKKLTKLVNEAKAMPVPAHPNEGQQVTALLSSVRATKQLVKDKRQRELEEMRAWLVYEQGSCQACGAEDPHGCLSAECAWTRI